MNQAAYVLLLIPTGTVLLVLILGVLWDRWDRRRDRRRKAQRWRP